MVAKVENNLKNKSDIALWILTIGLFVFGIMGYYYFSSQLLLVRVVALLLVSSLSLFFASKTDVGQIALRYWQEAMIELKRVVWPTKKETVQTTMAVLVMIFSMGVFLWIIDSLLLRLVAKVLS